MTRLNYFSKKYLNLDYKSFNRDRFIKIKSTIGTTKPKMLLIYLLNHRLTEMSRIPNKIKIVMILEQNSSSMISKSRN